MSEKSLRPRHRVVLAGLGRMGRNHFRILKSHPAFDLVGVIERNPAAAQSVDLAGVPVLASLSDVDWSKVDAAVVATPTGTHADVATQIIERGKHLLVEKPLASTSEQSKKLSRLASEKGVLLGVGHVERFNPAVLKLQEVIKQEWVGKPIHFSITRVGGYPSTALEGNNVILDLAVHDIDLIRKLLGPVRLVSSICHSTLKKDVIDTAEIVLMSREGVSVTLSMNWITPTKIRSVRVTGTRAVCMVDYILQTCQLFGGSLLNSAKEVESFDFKKIVDMYQNSDRIELGVIKEEPLKVEYDHFARMLTGQPHDLCSGEDAAQVVALADEAIRAGLSNRDAAKLPGVAWY